MTFRLRFPFQFPSGYKIFQFDEPIDCTFDGISIKIEQSGEYSILYAQVFESVEDAEIFLNRIWAGFMWVLLNQGLPFNANLDLDQVKYSKEPEQAAKNFGLKDKIDGFAFADQPSIYPCDKKISFISSSHPNITAGPNIERFLPKLVEGISFPKSHEVYQDAKLQTALELYNAYFSDSSSSARFLTLVMALETLTETETKPEFVINLLDDWKKQVVELKTEFEADSDEYIGIDALARELLFRKQASIRSQIRSMVRNTLEMIGNPEAKMLASQAVKIYDYRSTLVHKGKLPADVLRKVQTEARQILELVLKAKFETLAEISLAG